MTPWPTRLNRLLFRLPGRLDDDHLAILRTALADAEVEADVEAIGEHLVWAVRAGALPLTWAEFQLVAEEGSWALDDELPAMLVPEPPEVTVWFSSPPGPTTGGLPELLIRDAGSRLTGVWLAHRHDPEDPGPVPVWLVETYRGSDLVELTADLQQALAEAGEIPPRVEVFEEGEDLAPYHRAALEVAQLLWTDPGAELPRLPRVFDGADSERGPFFAEGHPVVADLLRARLLDYLTAGEVLLDGLGVMDDVVDPSAAGAVPAGFRTDGAWVWPDAVAYYLERHGLAPDPELVQHVLRTAGPPPRPGRVATGLALAALTDES